MWDSNLWWISSSIVLSQEAMEKDTLDKASEPEINLKSYLSDAYLHPIFHSFEEVELAEVKVDKDPVNIPSQLEPKPETETEPAFPSRSPSPPHHLDEEHEEESVTVQHYEVGPPANIYHYGYEHHESIFHYNMDRYQATQHDVQEYVVESPRGYYRYWVEFESKRVFVYSLAHKMLTSFTR